MNRVTLIRNFASLACGEHVIISRNRDVWSMSMIDSHPRLILPVDLDAKDESDNREEYIFCDYDEYENACGVDHFKLPCEMVATDWAIEWLQDPEHRKQAKAFERAYFGH